MFDLLKMEESIRLFIEAVGEDSKRDGLVESPSRVAKFYKTVLDGQDIDPKKYLKLFESSSTDMVMVEAPIYSFCEHHFALFSGKIHIAYIPTGQVIGLSKLIRIARVFAKRLQIQERLTKQISDFFVEHLSPDTAIHIEAEHSCMSIRGIRTPGAKTNTIRMTGVFKTDSNIHQEFMQFIK